MCLSDRKISRVPVLREFQNCRSNKEALLQMAPARGMWLATSMRLVVGEIDQRSVRSLEQADIGSNGTDRCRVEQDSYVIPCNFPMGMGYISWTEYRPRKI